MRCNGTEIDAVFTCSLEQHISPRKTKTALNIQWNLKSCGSGFCMLPILASTPSFSSHSFGKTFLFVAITGMRKVLRLKLSLWDQSCSSFHSPRLPFLPGNHKQLEFSVGTNSSKSRLDLGLPLNSASLNHYCILLIKEYHYCDSISYSKADLKIIQVSQGSGGLGVSWFRLSGLTKPESIICNIPINKGCFAAGVEDGHCYFVIKLVLF